jgi:uncharacterized protein (DUF362 family)
MPKVVLARSNNYDQECKRKIKHLIKLLGGIEKIVQPDNLVLIKPNLVTPCDGESGSVTHSSLIEPLIEMCYEAGAKKIFVGEGSGEVDTFKAFVSSGVNIVFDRLRDKGIPVEFVDLNYDKNPDTNNFDAIDLGPLALNSGHVYRVAHTVFKVDVIISVPKLKSHNGAGITSSLKNIIGIAPGGYYGFPKRKGNVDVLPHFTDAPWHSSTRYDRIWRTTIDLNRIALGLYPGSPKRRRYLAVVDGIIGGVYYKLVQALPLWKPIKVGALIAGTDPVAVDTVCARIMCYVPERIPTIVQAAKNGLGTTSDIDIIGEQVENLCKFFQPSRNWLNIVDLGSRKVWPNVFLLYLRKAASDMAFKLKINRFIEKFHL